MNSIKNTQRARLTYATGGVVAAVVLGLGASVGAASAQSHTPSTQPCYGECTPALAAYSLQAATGERYWPNLRPGSRGARVALVQRLLNDEGADLVVDGIYGRHTAAAVTSFQRASGLRSTGKMGDRTFERLLPSVVRGDRGGEVRALQRRLVQEGQPVVVDGIFGPRTADAVSHFQGRNGLVRDEVVGPLTWFRLVWS
jgi:peptidoglycan hydrolase-like protein with peptidoglycan-binding domain